jgi:hypothetical protein
LVWKSPALAARLLALASPFKALTQNAGYAYRDRASDYDKAAPDRDSELKLN